MRLVMGACGRAEVAAADGNAAYQGACIEDGRDDNALIQRIRSVHLPDQSFLPLVPAMRHRFETPIWWVNRGTQLPVIFTLAKTNKWFATMRETTKLFSFPTHPTAAQHAWQRRYCPPFPSHPRKQPKQDNSARRCISFPPFMACWATSVDTSPACSLAASGH
jgi:hypothetical protein